MTAFARKVLSALPDTTSAGNANNYTTLQEFTADYDKAERQDRPAGVADAVAVRPLRLPQPRHVRSAADPAAVGRRRQRRTSTRATGRSCSATTWTPSEPSLLEARFGYSWTQAGKNPPALGSDERAGAVRPARPADRSAHLRRPADAASSPAIRISAARRPTRSGSTRRSTTRR